MPVYEYHCGACDEKFETYLPLADYRTPQKHTCGMVAERRIYSPPLVCFDLPGYESPVTGSWVEGRVARRRDLERSGCRPYDPGEREELSKLRRVENERFEKSLEVTLDEAITTMPTRKRELLEQEARAGVTAELVRLPA